MLWESTIVMHVARTLIRRKRSGKLKAGAIEMVVDEECDAVLYELRALDRSTIDALGGWQAVLAAADPEARRAWDLARHALTRTLDLADVVDAIVHVLDGVAQVQSREQRQFDVDLDSTNYRAVERAALIIGGWEHDGARRWMQRLLMSAAQLRGAELLIAPNHHALALPSAAELSARVASGEIAVRTMMALVKHDVADARELLARHREGGG